MKKTNLRYAMLLALGLGWSNLASAVGLGPIEVSSYYGQPLNAMIRVDGVRNPEQTIIRLAGHEAYATRGIKREASHEDLRFQLKKAKGGKYYIAVSSQRGIADPLLNFLITVNSGGNVITREYSVFLDPDPAQAAGLGSNQQYAYAANDYSRAEAVENLNTNVAKPGMPQMGAAPTQVQHTARPAGSAQSGEFIHISGRAPVQSSQGANVRSASVGSYGPVQAGETLYSIANATRPPHVDVKTMIRAIQRANPQAFFTRSPSSLKIGAVLVIPQEVHAAPKSDAPVAKKSNRAQKKAKYESSSDMSMAAPAESISYAPPKQKNTVAPVQEPVWQAPTQAETAVTPSEEKQEPQAEIMTQPEMTQPEPTQPETTQVVSHVEPSSPTAGVDIKADNSMENQVFTMTTVTEPETSTPAPEALPEAAPVMKETKAETPAELVVVPEPMEVKTEAVVEKPVTPPPSPPPPPQNITPPAPVAATPVEEEGMPWWIWAAAGGGGFLLLGGLAYFLWARRRAGEYHGENVEEMSDEEVEAILAEAGLNDDFPMEDDIKRLHAEEENLNALDEGQFNFDGLEEALLEQEEPSYADVTPKQNEDDGMGSMFIDDNELLDMGEFDAHGDERPLNASEEFFEVDLFTDNDVTSSEDWTDFEPTFGTSMENSFITAEPETPAVDPFAHTLEDFDPFEINLGDFDEPAPPAQSASEDEFLHFGDELSLGFEETPQAEAELSFSKTEEQISTENDWSNWMEETPSASVQATPDPVVEHMQQVAEQVDAEAMEINLDLATSFLATGNGDRAKEWLMEVLKKGNAEQKLRAQELLDSIDHV